MPQDGENAEVAAVAERHGARRIVHPRKVLKFKPGTYIAKFPGYSYLAVHYGWALGTLFADAAAYAARHPSCGPATGAASSL